MGLGELLRVIVQNPGFLFVFAAIVLLIVALVYVARIKLPSSPPPKDFFDDKRGPAGETTSITLPVSTPVSNVEVHSIKVPKTTPYNAHNAKALVEHLAESYRGNLIFRLSTASGKVTFEIIDYQATPKRSDIAPSFESVYGPHVQIDTRPFTRTSYTDRIRYHLLAPLWHPSLFEGKWFLSSIHLSEAVEDPLIYVAHLMGAVAKSGVVANLSFILEDADSGTPEEREAARRKILGLPSDTEVLILAAIALVTGVAPVTRKPAPPDQIQKQLLAKAQSPNLYQLYLVLEVYGDNDRLVVDTANNIVGHLWNQYRGEVAGINYFKEPVTGPTKAHKMTSQAQLDKYSLPTYMKFLKDHPDAVTKTCAVLTSDELAALWHLPYEGMADEYVTFAPTGQPSAAILGNTQGVTIGKNGDDEIKLPDMGDPKHTNIVGKSGKGKSTLMINRVRQDIQAGRGVAVVDPHGQMITDILRSCIPEERINDVVLIDIANTAYPPPLNPLSLPDESGQIGVGQVFAILDKVYGFESAPRAKTVTEAALRTLQFVKQPTVRDAVKLFTDTLKRQELLQKYMSQLDPATREFWNDYGNMSIRIQDERVSPVTTRLRRFYSGNELYAMMCHPGTLDWKRHLSDHHIILISLKANKAIVPPSEAQLLGALVVSQLEIAANSFKADKFDFRLYVDEAQKFVTTSLPEMFEEIRKNGVWLTIANQYLGQMTGKTLTAVMGNVTTTYAFEVSADDARELAPYVRPVFTVEDMVALGEYHAVVKTSLNNVAQPAFRIDTLPPPPEDPDADAREARIRQRSIEQWTPKTRAEVLDWLNKRYPDENIFTPQPQSDSETDADEDEDWEVDSQ